MARRGRYGQLPQASPDLTSTIISIARQMESLRESNLMDAWKNGGVFEGKPVTDDTVLSFWRDRLKTVDKRDPLYDTYSNTLTQTEYSIAESKMSTWYAQSKGDASADRRMASFYNSWAKKVPANSEFYRVLQRDAAQFIRAAIAKDKVGSGGGGGGGGKGGSGGPTKAQLKAQAYNDAQHATYMQHEQLGDFLTNVLTQAAKGQGLIGVAATKDLTDFDPSDPSKMLLVLDQINNHPELPVYYTAEGAVTGKAILDVVHQLDPHFDGKLTTDYYGKALDGQLTGLQTRLDLATQTNHKTDMNALKKQIGAATELGRESNAWSIEKTYQQLRTNFLTTWLDPTTTPDQKVEAWKTYSSGLVNLATSKTHPPDQNTFTRLIAEVNGDGNVDSLAENFTGLNSGDHSSLNGGSQGDIADTHASLQNFLGQQQAVATGQAVWAIGTTDSQGVFHPGAGNEIGAANPTDVEQASPEGAIQVWVTQNGAKPIPVWVAGKTVTAKVVQADGNPVTATNPDARKVATAYDVTVDGHTTRIFAYQAPGGRTMYTTDAPWGPDVQAHDSGGQVQLTVRLSGIPTADSVANDPNFTVVRNEDGSVRDITVDPGRFVLTATDPVRFAAGPDPNADSLSPSIAMYMGSTESRSQLADLSGNADFRQTVDRDLRLAAGGQYDPTTGHVIGGDPAVYNEGAAQAGFAYRMNDPRAIGLGPAGGEVFFERTTTRGAFEVAPPTADNALPAARTGSMYSPPSENRSTLPSDQARGTAFNGLASVFQPGTNRLMPQTPTAEDRLAIQGPQQLRVPAAPTPTATPQTVGLAPTPVPPPTPVAAADAAAMNAPRPTPVAPTPVPTPPKPVAVPAASAGFGSEDAVTTPAATLAPPKPQSTPRPLQPKTGQRPV